MEISDLNFYQSAYTGKQIDDSISRIVTGEIDEKADQAAAAAEEATRSAQAVKNALDNLPPGAVPVIDDLTTGGSAVALSAQQGVVLKGMVDSKVPATRTIDGKPLSGDVTILPTGGLQGQALVKTSAEGGAVEWGPWPSNPNLLDNWYFLDPINQRGETEYTEAGYTIDRWKIIQGNSLEKVASGIKVSRNGNSALSMALQEHLEPFTLPTGTPITFSVLVTENTSETTGGLRIGGHAGAPIPPRAVGLFSFTDTWYESLNYNPYFGLFFGTTTEISSMTLAAMKLEPGTEQTLAHQDAAGNWVLNDPPPNKALELAKCQYYYQNLPQHTAFVVVFSTDAYTDLIYSGPPMRTGGTLVHPEYIDPEATGGSFVEDAPFEANNHRLRVFDMKNKTAGSVVWVLRGNSGISSDL